MHLPGPENQHPAPQTDKYLIGQPFVTPPPDPTAAQEAQGHVSPGDWKPVRGTRSAPLTCAGLAREQRAGARAAQVNKHKDRSNYKGAAALCW